MAITQAPLAALAETVKQSVTSPQSCSSATLSHLQKILGTHKSTQKSCGEKRAAKTGTNRTTTRVGTQLPNGPPAKQVKSRSTTKTTVFAIHEEPPSDLAPQVRTAFATEVFNRSLKTLTDETKRLPKDPSGQKLPTQSPSPHKDTAAKQVLQPCSPNQRRKHSGKADPARAAPSTCGTTPGLVVLAECAQAALACLRADRGDNSGPNRQHAVQLEQGALILVGKLIALGLVQHAKEEIQQVRRRINTFLGHSEPELKRDIISSSKECISSMMKFCTVPNDGMTLNLILSLQGHVLRILATNDTMGFVLALPENLEMSVNSSPAALILAAWSAGRLPAEKASQHLQSFVYLVLNLASRVGDAVSSTLTTTTTASDRQLLRSSFRLHCVASQMRCLMWRIAGHKCDLEKELWDPFARSLRRFRQQSLHADPSDYEIVSLAFSQLKEVALTNGLGSADCLMKTISSSSIPKTLASIAEDCGRISEAIQTHIASLELLSSPNSLTACIIRCRIGACYLQDLNTDTFKKANDHLRHAANGMRGALKASPSELDELLTAAGKVRKVLVLALQRSGKLQDHGKGNLEDGLQILSSEFVFAFTKFLSRYLGHGPSADDAESRNRFASRVEKVGNIAKATIESAITACKRSILAGENAIEVTDVVVEDCSRVYSAIEKEQPAEDNSKDDDKDPKPTISVKLSNIYWFHYLKHKQDLRSSELLNLLKRSTSLLLSRSPQEQRSGFLALKLERTALLYVDSERFQDAATSFQRSIKVHIECGTLEGAASRAMTMDPRAVFDDVNEDIHALGRVLASAARFSLNRVHLSGIPLFFDDERLAAAQRGLILEWQLSSVIDLPGSDAAIEPIDTVAETLLRLYDESRYPIRRMRVLARLSRSALSQTQKLNNRTVELLQSTSVKGLSPSKVGADTGLWSYVPYFSGSLALSHALEDANASNGVLDSVLLSWSSVIKDATDWKSVARSVDEPRELHAQLNMLVDFAEAKGMWKLKLAALHLLQRLLELRPEPDTSDLVFCLSQQGVQYSRLGYSTEAGKILGLARSMISSQELNLLDSLRCFLGYAEYLAEIGNFQKSHDAMTEAENIYREMWAASNSDRQSWSSREKRLLDVTCVQAALISSRLAMEEGDLKSAMLFAKFSVRSGSQVWASLERSAGTFQMISTHTNNANEIDALTGRMSTLSTSELNSHNSSSPSRGAIFWPHVSWRVLSLLHLSQLSADAGLFQDAIYYGEQALKAADAVGSYTFQTACRSVLGCHWAHGRDFRMADDLLQTSCLPKEEIEIELGNITNVKSLITLRRLQGRNDEAAQLVNSAQRMVLRMSNSRIIAQITDFSTETSTVEGVSAPKLKVNKQQQPIKSRANPTKKRGLPKQPTAIEATDSQNSIPPGAISFLRAQRDLYSEKACISMAIGNRKEASSLLNESEGLPSNVQGQLRWKLLRSQLELSASLKALAAHPVFCVLAESTVSFPAQRGTSGSGEVAVLPHSLQPGSRPLPYPERGEKLTKPRNLAKKADQEFSVEMMVQARQLNAEGHALCLRVGSPSQIHRSTKLLNRYDMLLSVFPASSRFTPMHAAQTKELGKTLVLERERFTIDVDKHLSSMDLRHAWPTKLGAIATSRTYEDSRIDSTVFQTQYIDILPPSWSVISISLNEDYSELFISKLRSSQGPFLIRVPICRSSPDDEDGSFGFCEAKDELLEIIRAANLSAHDARDRTDKDAKKGWWAQRESLDERLKELLLNIENSWLGGFRGLFSSRSRRATFFPAFSQTFLNMLDAHLPSRQKAQREHGPKVDLHPQVLDLFVGLPHPDENELDEAVTDLLYFVVDVLQFHGERNAYDEIDFDVMVVETLDALRHYHEGIKANAPPESENHTILILDKELHAFPWEALPCLEGTPVSRMPSLGSLRQMILRLQQNSASRDGLHVDRHNGSYVLNPGGDLTGTQDTFAGPFRSSLPTWNSIVAREPSEEECRSALQNRELFLYFGHGSGAQYIRGRTIKRLDKCAVAFLMGCSSGTVSEHGEFEPHGTPINYMQAGSPALVATLWDVTDKDIDRFAISSFRAWGLLDGATDQQGAKTGKPVRLRGKGRKAAPSQAVESAPSGSGMSLDKAVAQARDACVLKYLNGAAPVIYGIPVYLK